MKTIKDIQQMMKEPASKEWFKKHGTPKSKALKKVSHHGTDFSSTKFKERTKNWPKASHEKIDTVDYQKKFKRAYND